MRIFKPLRFYSKKTKSISLKTHDLNTLIDRFASRFEPSAAVVSAASMLTSIAVEFRYPGTDADIVDARDALNSAAEIMDWTMAILDQMP